ncbi:MAG: AAA family ATPase [Planctomycetota bacterium]|jgi:archaellum biogenesis ATPase FlaH
MANKSNKSNYISALGIELRKSSGNQMVGDCPFCDKAGHLYVNKETGQWDCKVCGKSGNPINFMTGMMSILQGTTRRQDRQSLAKERGIYSLMIRNFGLAWNGDCWLIPYRNKNGNVVAINRWNPGTKRAKQLPGISTSLFNVDRLAESEPSATVWLCEGEWDAMAMTYILQKNDRPDVTVALPGVMTFKEEWASWFKDRDVYIAFDNDEAGQRAIPKAVKRLVNAKSIQVVKWPEEKPEGYDIRDCLIDAGSDYNNALLTLKSTLTEPQLETRFKPVYRVIADIESQEVEFVWDGIIPRGKLTMIAGDPGLGKSYLSLDIAARVSAGLPWPDSGKPAEKGSVIVLSFEDDAEDTIRPRLETMGADLSCVITLDGVRQSNTDAEESFTLDAHLPVLEKLIKEIDDVRLVIIDPVDSFLGRGVDSHKNADVRRVLGPLSKMAGKHRIAVLAVTHLNKGSTGGKSIYRVTGSIGMPAAARSVWMVTRGIEQDEIPSGDSFSAIWQRASLQGNMSEWRLFTPVKANLAPDLGCHALRFRIAHGRVKWSEKRIDIHADAALDSELIRSSPKPSEAGRVEEFLEKLLSNGPVTAKHVGTERRKAQIKDKTLQRAKKKLGIQSKQFHRNGGAYWMWGWPDQLKSHKEKSDA